MALVEDLLLRISASGGRPAAAEVGALRGEVDKTAMSAVGFSKNLSAAAVAANAGMAKSAVGIRGHLASVRSDIGAAGGGLGGIAAVAFSSLSNAASAAERSLGGSMSKIKSHLSSALSGLGGAAATVGKTGALAAGAAAVGGAVVVGKAVETTEQMMVAAQAMHTVTGMTTRDALAWSIATNAYGVNARAMSISLKTLATQAVAAQSGTPKSVELFKSMSISMKDLQATGGNLNSMYMLMIDHLNKMPAGAQRTADTAKLLGRNWTALLPLLEQGSKGIKQVTDLMHQFGLKTGGDTVTQLNRFHAAQIKLHETSMVLQMVLAEKVIPVLTKLIPVAITVAHTIGVGLVSAFHWVRAAVIDVEGWIHQHQKTWQTLGHIATSVWKGIVSVVQTAWPILKGVFMMAAGALQVMGAAFTKLWAVVEPVVHQIGNILLWVWNNVISPVAKWIGGALQTISGAFSSLSGVITGLLSPISLVLSGIQSIFNSQVKLAAGNVPTAAQWQGILSSGNPNYIAPPHGAAGAIVTRPTLAWVGDKGPEKVVPLNQAPGASPLPPSHTPADGHPIAAENHITFQVGAREFARAVVYSTGKVKATT